MARVVIFGNGQVAEVALHYLTKDSPHEVVAFTVDTEYLKEDSFHGLPVLAFEELEADHPPDSVRLFITIPSTEVNGLRARKYREARERGYGFISYVSSRAICETDVVGENCFILENNVIQPYVRIGNNVTLWSGNHIGHHSVIEDHCFIASHVVVSGAVTLGERTFIGVNATIRDNITIGKANVIGAGAVILKSTEDLAVFKAVPTEPARITSDRLRRL